MKYNSATIKYLLLSLFLGLFVFSSQAQVRKHSLHFDNNSSTIKKEEIQQLESYLADLDHPITDYTIKIIGHTDNIGELERNKQLSLQRALKVKECLLKQGLDSNKINVKLAIDRNPIASNQSEKGRVLNRRVEIISNPYNRSVPSQVWTFDASEGGDFIYERSQTKINIPANSLLYPNKKVVKGEIDLVYTEYRDFADFIFSDIPMNYKGIPFNSAGMLNISAYQNGEKLLIDPSKRVTVDFNLTDSLPHLSFYEYNEEQKDWRVVGPLDLDKKENDFGGKLVGQENTSKVQELGYYHGRRDCGWVGVRYFFKAVEAEIISKENPNSFPADIELQKNFPKKDTIENFRAALKFGIELMSKPELDIPNYCRGFNLPNKYATAWPSMKNDWVYLDQSRYALAQVAGSELMDNQAFYNIKIKVGKRPKKRGRYSISIEDLDGSHPELAILNDYDWYIYHRYTLADILSKKWFDLRVSTNRGDFLTLHLKGYGSIYTINIYPSFKHKALKNKSQRSILISLVKQVENARKKTVHAYNKKLKAYNQTYFKYLAIDQLLKSNLERAQTFNKWRSYMSSNKEVLKARYEDWLRIAEDSIHTLSLIDSLIENTSFCYINANRIGSKRLIVRKHGRVANLRRLPTVYQIKGTALEEERINRTVSKIEANVTQRIFLNNFGIYNCDQIVNILDEKEGVLADFQDRTGKRIQIAEVFIKDYRLNTLRPYRKGQIRFNPKNKYAIFILDNKGDKYLLKANEIKNQLTSEMTTSCTFVMKDVSEEILSPESLRDALK